MQANQIDSSAARELRAETPWVVWAVLERGPLRACTNPSGALVSRIRDAKRGTLAGPRYGVPAHAGPPPANASDLDRFLAENRIDQGAVASMKGESPEVQKLVMAKGPLLNTNNPSASLMARIRIVKSELVNGSTLPTPAPPGIVPGFNSLAPMPPAPPAAPWVRPAWPVFSGTAPAPTSTTVAVRPGLQGSGGSDANRARSRSREPNVDRTLQAAAMEAIQALQASHLVS